MPEGRAPGLDKVLIADTTGLPLGTTGNPLVTSPSGGSGGTVSQGTGGSIASPWFVRPTADGATTSLPLPTGAATESTLAAASAKLPTALGQQLNAGSLSITFASNIPTLPVSIPGNAFDRNVTGSITGSDAVSLSTQGCGVVALQLSGTWTGTVSFEASVDSSAWVAFPMDPTGVGSSPVTSATANGTWTGAVAGYQSFRAVGATVASGTATAYINASTASTTVTVEDSALPNGAATSAAQVTGNASLSSIDGKTPSLGQAVMASSAPVAIASDQTAIPVSGTVAVSNAFALDATLTGGTQKSRITDGTNDVAVVNAAPTTQYGLVVRNVPAAATAPSGVELSDGSAFYTAAKTGQLPAALGATTKAVSLSVAPATDSVGTAGSASATVYTVQGVASMTPLKVDPTATGTWTLTSVASSATSVTILASNASRRGLTLFNNSTAQLYLYFSSSSATTTTACTVSVFANSLYEMPAPIYTGQITGIWASANGSAQVSELT